MRGIGKFGMYAARWVKQFVRAERGNTAMIFALASVSLLASAGAGIDLSRALVTKTRLAGALDAAALAVGTTSGLTITQLQTMAQQYFDANYPVTALGSHNPVNVSVSGLTTTLTVTGSVPTTLLQILDIDKFDLAVSNDVVRSVTKLRVALVLDNTGSMSASGKIGALKTASHQLLDQLKAAAITPGDVQVAIIPFALDVNFGTGSVGATWIDWSDFDSAPPNPPAVATFATFGPPPQAKNPACPYGTTTGTSPYGYRCTTGSANGAGSTNTIPASGLICPGMDSGNFNTGRGGHYYNGCYNSVKQTSSCSINCLYNHTWIKNLHSTWTGCMMDRTQSEDVKNTTPAAGTPATLFPAENNAYCPPVPLMGLSTDWTALNSMVDTMTPNGSTNQTIGLAWGWQALTQGNPLNAPAVDPTIQNVIVLLSDGLNTQDRWYGDGSTTSTSVDNRMALACANAKAAGVKIYTVLVMSGSSAILQSCATDSSKYFALTTAGAIVTAFNQIGTELANLHLAR